jgi:hypothetical protein
MLRDPTLLLWAAEANKEDVRLGGFDVFDHLLIFIGADGPKRWSESEGNVQAGEAPPNSPNQFVQNLLTPPVEAHR